MAINSRNAFEITPLDEYVVQCIKTYPLIYDCNSPYYYSAAKRQAIFNEISEGIELLYHIRIKGADISQRWAKIRQQYTRIDLKKKRGKRLKEKDKEIIELLKFLDMYTSHKETFSDDSLDELKFPTIDVNDPKCYENSPEIYKIIKSIFNKNEAYVSTLTSKTSNGEKNSEFIEISDEEDISQVEDGSDKIKLDLHKGKQKETREDSYFQKNRRNTEVLIDLTNKKNVTLTRCNTSFKKRSCTRKKGELKDALYVLDSTLKKQELDSQVTARANIICQHLNELPKDKIGLAFISIMKIFKSYTFKQ